ncbi:hypothetical protein HPG69_004789 [Diceros bicornis minor]|uniref:Uncharacterized protein n=1 Tax=Diceros bicornis minor TaxID=77932 RepID=A0A7J7E4G4_DICBM|nr:hypothetical protein HPG69_004789 [Diceros bicornis minor]
MKLQMDQMEKELSAVPSGVGQWRKAIELAISWTSVTFVEVVAVNTGSRSQTLEFINEGKENLFCISPRSYNNRKRYGTQVKLSSSRRYSFTYPMRPEYSNLEAQEQFNFFNDRMGRFSSRGVMSSCEQAHSGCRRVWIVQTAHECLLQQAGGDMRGPRI